MAESCSAVSGVAIAGGADISRRLVARVRSMETSKTLSLFWEAPVCTRGGSFTGGSMEGAWSRWERNHRGLMNFTYTCSGSWSSRLSICPLGTNPAFANNALAAVFDALVEANSLGVLHAACAAVSNRSATP